MSQEIGEGLNIALTAFRLATLFAADSIYVTPNSVVAVEAEPSVRLAVSKETLNADVLSEPRLAKLKEYLQPYRPHLAVYRFRVEGVSFDAAVAFFSVHEDMAQTVVSDLVSLGCVVKKGRREYARKVGYVVPVTAALPLSSLSELELFLQRVQNGLRAQAQLRELPYFLEPVDNDLCWLKKSALKNENEFLVVYARAGDVIVTENALRFAGVVVMRGERLYVQRRALPVLYAAIYEIETRAPLAALALWSGEGVQPIDYSELKRWEEIWKVALSPPPPQPVLPELQVRVRTVETTRGFAVSAQIEGCDLTVTIEPRLTYVLASVSTRLDISLEAITAIFKQYSFEQGTYGGYIRRQRISASEAQAIATALQNALTQLLPLIRDQLARRAEVDYHDTLDRIARARASVGLNVPPTQPLTPEHIAALLNVALQRPQVTVVAATTQATAQPAARAEEQVEQRRTAQRAAEVREEVEVIPVCGFLVSSSLPSTALLDAHLPEIFKNEKVGTKLVNFVRGWFYNRLKSLSRDFYTRLLPNYAYSTPFGYVVPAHKAGAFLAAVEELRRKYEEYERALKDFLLYGKVPERMDQRAKVDPAYVDLVKEYLRQQGAGDAFEERVHSLDIASRFRVVLIPFALDRDALSPLLELIDEKVREKIEKEIEVTKRQIVGEVAEQMRERCKKLLERLRKLETPSEGLLKFIQKEVEMLERDMRTLGVKAELVPELEQVKENIAKRVPPTSSERVEALLTF